MEEKPEGCGSWNSGIVRCRRVDGEWLLLTKAQLDMVESTMWGMLEMRGGGCSERGVRGR